MKKITKEYLINLMVENGLKAQETFSEDNSIPLNVKYELADEFYHDGIVVYYYPINEKITIWSEVNNFRNPRITLIKQELNEKEIIKAVQKALNEEIAYIKKNK